MSKEPYSEQMRRGDGWRVRLWILWFNFIDAAWYWFWAWPRDCLVWDFNTYPEGRLMHARTRRFLSDDDPRHYGSIDDK